MKIVAIIENSITDGGGFNQALNAVTQMNNLKDDFYSFSVLTSNKANIPIIEKLGIKAQLFHKSFFDKVVAALSSHEITRRLQQKIKIIGGLEKKLIGMGCDLVYFVTPTSRVASLQKLNYILTVWDNCHRDRPEFPEVRSFGEHHRREYIYKNYLSSAYFSVVESEKLATKITCRYGVDRERILIMPFSVNPMMDYHENKSINTSEILSFYNIEKGYFFYPAQFWPHKNHIRIIQALKILNNQGKFFNVVFVGGEKGNLKKIKKLSIEMGLYSQVKFLGFVDNNHMPALYDGSSAVIMSSYFGYTNIPPLESWTFKKPLIYSSLFFEQAQDAALLFNPDNEMELASMMVKSQDPKISQNLIKKGIQRLTDINSHRNLSEKDMLTRLKQFNKRLDCWKF
jgi:glycosyltransferase involved in cell wall biosynthesis